MTTDQPTLLPALRQFVTVTRLSALVPPEQLERGLAEFEADLLRVALDIQLAATRGLSLSTACHDSANYPHLNRIHVGLRDILTLELPADLLLWVRALVARPDGALSGDELQLALSRAALSPEQHPVLRVLAQYALFESLRVALLLSDHVRQASVNVLPQVAGSPAREAPGFAAIGVDEAAVDGLAEDEVRWWLAKAGAFEGDVRPLNVLLSSALLQLEQFANDIGILLASAQRETLEQLRQRDELKRHLQRMNAPDAVLVRNVVGVHIGEQRLSVKVLKEHHQIALGDREAGALNTQLHRLAEKIGGGAWPERNRPALVDLFAEALAKETA
jgi:hypothetical protein